MLCMKCQKDNTTCVDDMLQINYVAEIYKCNDCGGEIEVEYDGKISKDTIKKYRYLAAGKPAKENCEHTQLQNVELEFPKYMIMECKDCGTLIKLNDLAVIAQHTLIPRLDQGGVVTEISEFTNANSPSPREK